MGHISVIIPIFNEATNIQPLYSAIHDAFVDLSHEFEVLFVDDGSSDESAQVVKQIHERDKRAKLVSLSRNFGHQVALTAGMDHARGDAVVMMDADLQHPPELIKKMISEWEQGYDVVYTVREKEDSVSFSKNFSARMFYLLFRIFSNIKIPFGVADFRLLDRKVISAFSEIRERNRFLRGLTFWVGYRRKEIKYTAQKRHSGSTKYNWSRMISFAIDGITSFSTVPLLFSIFIGFMMAGAGFLYGCYAIYARFFTDWTIPGWSSLMIFTSTIGGLQLILLGVLGVYIGKIYEETKQRPIYLVQTTLGLDE